MINGVVMAWSSDVSAGVIRAQNGKRIFFSRKEWMSVTLPCVGQNVVLNNGPKGALLVYFESDARTQQRAHA
jgi:hypothetical protein